MRPRVPVKYRDFPGPFAPYRPIAAKRNFLVIIPLVFVWIGAPLLLVTQLPFIFTTAPVLLGASVLAGYLWQTRWKRRSTPHNWLLCLKCAYPLSQLPPVGRCPECGESYTHASTSWGWRVLCNQWTDDMDPPPPLPSKSP